MQRILPLIALLGMPVMSSAQALSNAGAAIYITSGADVYVNGDLSNSSTATINNSGSLHLTGNFTNDGATTSPAGSVLHLQGAGAQALNGAAPVNAWNAEINNAATVTMNTPLNVAGMLTFTNGIVVAGSIPNAVIIAAGGSVSGASDASHVDGYVKKLGTGAFTFPVGDAIKYQPLGINLSANANGMTARYYGTDAGAAPFGTGGSSAVPLLYHNPQEYWDLTPVTTATGTVSIYFDGYKNTGIGSTADLRVAHKSGGQWLNEGGTATGTTSAGSVTSNSISTFSPFTLGSIAGSSPLPITLISFSGGAAGRTNLLSWQTAAEDNGSFFTVARSSNGSSFETTGAVTGTGSYSSYTFSDEQPFSPVTYYRLQMKDGSGTITYSNTVAVQRDAAGEGIISVWPVPAADILTITNTTVSLNGQLATITDVQGRTIAEVQLSQTTQVDVSGWPQGVYLLRLPAGGCVRIVKE